MADVFVSYSRSDKARVAPLVAAIEAAGWSVWWDPDIEPGQEFDQQITAELDDAAAVVVVWTSTSVSSRWVRGEAREAADHGKLVPVRFDGANLPLDFRAIHTIDLDRWGENAKSQTAEELLRAIRTTVTRQRPAANPVATPPLQKISSSIAVLPFANLTGDPSKDFLGDGLAEELVHVLARVPGLHIPSRTSSFAYRGRDVDLRRIARELQVSTVLEGSVRAAGERIRVTAQLIDGQSGYHLWSQHYDRKFEDLFELQDELSNSIVLQALATAFDWSPRVHQEPREPPTRNLDAYLLFLGAVSDYSKGVVAAQTFEKLQAALRLDPDFARARALMAEIRSLSLLFGVPLPGTLAEAERDALHALDATPDSASALAAVGVFRAAQGHWVHAHDHFQRAKEQAASEPDLWMRHALFVLGSVGHLRANAACTSRPCASRLRRRCSTWPWRSRTL